MNKLFLIYTIYFYGGILCYSQIPFQTGLMITEGVLNWLVRPHSTSNFKPDSLNKPREINTPDKITRISTEDIDSTKFNEDSTILLYSISFKNKKYLYKSVNFNDTVLFYFSVFNYADRDKAEWRRLSLPNSKIEMFYQGEKLVTNYKRPERIKGGCFGDQTMYRYYNFQNLQIKNITPCSGGSVQAKELDELFYKIFRL